MFDIELQAAVAKVSLSVKEHDGVIVRKCRMALEREFDDAISSGLGGDARKVLALLKSGDAMKVVIGIDEIEAQAELVGGLTGEVIKIGILRGDKATAKAGNEDDEAPTIRLEMECQYDREVWTFLGDNCGGYVRVTFRRRQLDLGTKAA